MKLLYLDFISPKITLYYKGFLKHSSLVSVFLTISSTITIIILGLIFSMDFFLKKNPTTLFYKRFIYDAGVFPLNSSSLLHFISFGKDNFDRRAYSIIGVNFKHEDLIEYQNETSFDHWIYGTCDEYDLQDKFKYLEGFIDYFKKGFCIKKFYNSTLKKSFNINESQFTHSFIAYGASNPNEIFYGIWIKRCQNNSILNDNFCLPENQIDQIILNSFNYSIIFIETNVDVENYKNPLQYFYHKINNDFSNTSYTLNALNYHPCMIKSRTGILFDESSYKFSYVYDQNEKLTFLKTKENNNLDLFGAFYFSMQNIQDVYDRKYKKFQDIAGNISGISNFIIIICKILNYFVHKFIIFCNSVNDLDEFYISLGNTIVKEKEKHSINVNFFKNLENNNKISKKSDTENYSNRNSNKNNEISNSLNNNNNNPNYIIENNKSLNSKNNLNYNNISNISSININNKNILNKNNKKHIFYKRTNQTFYSHSKIRSNYKYLTNFFNYVKNYFISSKRTIIEKLIDFREEIISEEEIFSIHYAINSFKKLIVEKQTVVCNNVSRFKTNNVISSKNKNSFYKNIYN